MFFPCHFGPKFTSSIANVLKMKKKITFFTPQRTPLTPKAVSALGFEKKNSQKTTRKYHSSEHSCKISSHLVLLLLGFSLV